MVSPTDEALETLQPAPKPPRPSPEPSSEPCWTWPSSDQSLPDLLRNLLRNLLQNPVEPDLALHEGFLEPSPEPSPDLYWTWPGSAPKPPTEPSPEPRWTWPGVCTSAHPSYSEVGPLVGSARVPVCPWIGVVPVCPCARGSGLCPGARATSPEVQKWHAGRQLQSAFWFPKQFVRVLPKARAPQKPCKANGTLRPWGWAEALEHEAPIPDSIAHIQNVPASSGYVQLNSWAQNARWFKLVQTGFRQVQSRFFYTKLLHRRALT